MDARMSRWIRVLRGGGPGSSGAPRADSREQQAQRLMFVLLAIAAAAMVARLWSNGFTSGDEGFTAVARWRSGGVWQAAVDMAKGHGRFFHLVVYPLAQIPYLFDSLAVVNVFRIATSGLVLVFYFGFVRALFGTRLALLTLFLFLGLFDTVGGSYNPFHGLPLWF